MLVQKGVHLLLLLGTNSLSPLGLHVVEVIIIIERMIQQQIYILHDKVWAVTTSSLLKESPKPAKCMTTDNLLGVGSGIRKAPRKSLRSSRLGHGTPCRVRPLNYHQSMVHVEAIIIDPCSTLLEMTGGQIFRD